MKIIVISGAAGAGKDTVGQIMKEKLEAQDYSVLITHYADLLKHLCINLFGWNGVKDEEGRSLLQYVGTDIVRKKAPDFWVDFICDILYLFDGEWDVVIIPDCRFPNELNRLREVGYQVTHVHVARNDFQSRLSSNQKNHASETSMDGVPADYEVLNNGTLDDLRESIEVVVSE